LTYDELSSILAEFDASVQFVDFIISSLGVAGVLSVLVIFLGRLALITGLFFVVPILLANTLSALIIPNNDPAI